MPSAVDLAGKVLSLSLSKPTRTAKRWARPPPKAVHKVQRRLDDPGAAKDIENGPARSLSQSAALIRLASAPTSSEAAPMVV